jgi:hypothetical protein
LNATDIKKDKHDRIGDGYIIKHFDTVVNIKGKRAFYQWSFK